MNNKLLNISRFHERFDFFIKKTGKKQREIAKELNVTEGAVNKWKNGTRFPKDDERLIQLAESLNVNVIDLLPYSHENREKIVKEELKNNLDLYIEQLPSTLIPPALKLIRVTKGYPSSSTNNIVQEDSMHYVTHIYIDKRMVKERYQDKELQAVVMIGDSMSPYLENDDIAIYHPLPSPIGDGRYVINTPHGLTIKKLKFFSSGSIRLISENHHYNTMGNYDEEFKHDEIDALEILGLVVGRILKS